MTNNCETDLQKEFGRNMTKKAMLWLLPLTVLFTVGSNARAQSLYSNVSEGVNAPHSAVLAYLKKYYPDVRLVQLSLRRNEDGKLEGSLDFTAEIGHLLTESGESKDADAISRGRAIVRVFLDKHAAELFELEHLSELYEFKTYVSSFKSEVNSEIVKSVFERHIYGVKVEGFDLRFSIRDKDRDAVSINLVPVAEVLQKTADQKLLDEGEVKQIVFSLPQWEHTEQEYRADKRFKMEKTLMPECLAYVVETSAWQVWLNATTGEVLKVVPTIIRD